MVYRKDSEKCKSCEHYEDCNSKRMVMCMVKEMRPPDSMLASAMEVGCAPLLEDMAVKHDYREIKVDSGTTITIDLEDIKKQIGRELYKSLECPFENGG